MFGVQNIGVTRVFERLQPSDLSVEGSRCDPSTLTPTYPVDPGWIRLEPNLLYVGATSINGTTLKVFDTTTTVTAALGARPPLANQRYYPQVVFDLVGNAVTPITLKCQLITAVGGTAFQMWSEDAVSPGVYTVGPFYVPGGFVFRMGCFTNGGVGQTLAIHALGYDAPRGVALPLIPPTVSNA